MKMTDKHVIGFLSKRIKSLKVRIEKLQYAILLYEGKPVVKKKKRGHESILTGKMERYIRENYLKQSGKSMARQFGIDPGVIQRFLKREGWHVPDELKEWFRVQAMKGRTTFTSEEDQYIRENYLKLPIRVIASALSRSSAGIKLRLQHMGLEIPIEILQQRVIGKRFRKGHVTHSKGRKQSEYMSPEGLKRAKASQFKKGNVHPNAYNEVGKITIHTTQGRSYKYICLKLGKWTPLHKVVWEKANGSIPKGHCLWFKDGDSLNSDLSNLELITRKENYLRNHPSKRLPDNYVANTLAWRDKELKQEILDNYPELIELKREQLKLTQEISKQNKI